MAALVFLCAVLAITYVILLYPIVLGVLSRLTRKPIQKRRLTYPVSVIIPVHNGAPFIAEKLRSVLASNYPWKEMQILVVSDASTDSTEDIVREFASQGVELLRVPRGGKPHAVNAGIRHARN